MLNPIIIGEVLSNSTEKYDREHKLPCYMTIPSVEVVFLVSQKEKKIEVFRKINQWGREIYEDDSVLEIMGCTLDMQRIYKRLVLEAALSWSRCYSKSLQYSLFSVSLYYEK